MHPLARPLASFAAAALAVLTPGLALADGPLDDTPAFSISTVAKPAEMGVSLSNRIGLTSEKVGGWGVIGFDRTGRHVDGNNSTNQVLQLGVGGRYLFSAPERANAAPYVYAQAVTNRRTANTDNDEMDDLIDDVQRYSLFAGFGGEVALTGALSISAELGLQHDVTNFDQDDVRLMSIHTHLDSGLAINVYF